MRIDDYEVIYKLFEMHKDRQVDFLSNTIVPAPKRKIPIYVIIQGEVVDSHDQSYLDKLVNEDYYQGINLGMLLGLESGGYNFNISNPYDDMQRFVLSYGDFIQKKYIDTLKFLPRYLAQPEIKKWYSERNLLKSIEKINELCSDILDIINLYNKNKARYNSKFKELEDKHNDLFRNYAIPIKIEIESINLSVSYSNISNIKTNTSKSPIVGVVIKSGEININQCQFASIASFDHLQDIDIPQEISILNTKIFSIAPFTSPTKTSKKSYWYLNNLTSPIGIINVLFTDDKNSNLYNHFNLIIDDDISKYQFKNKIDFDKMKIGIVEDFKERGDRQCSFYLREEDYYNFLYGDIIKKYPDVDQGILELLIKKLI